MRVIRIIIGSIVLCCLTAQPINQNYLNSLTQKQLSNRYKVPQFDIGMPRYNLRYGYLIFGSPYLRCNNEQGQYAIQNGNTGDYPHCLFPNGLVNTPPFTKHPHHLWGDGWGTDAIERKNPFNKEENYVKHIENRHLSN